MSVLEFFVGVCVGYVFGQLVRKYDDEYICSLSTVNYYKLYNRVEYENKRNEFHFIINRIAKKAINQCIDNDALLNDLRDLRCSIFFEKSEEYNILWSACIAQNVNHQLLANFLNI